MIWTIPFTGSMWKGFYFYFLTTAIVFTIFLSYSIQNIGSDGFLCLSCLLLHKTSGVCNGIYCSRLDTHFMHSTCCLHLYSWHCRLLATVLELSPQTLYTIASLFLPSQASPQKKISVYARTSDTVI